MQARAAVMPKRHGCWTIETLEVDEPGPQEVLVRVVASGICQTDVHARDGFFPIPCPAVYGHEGAGVVERVGRAVTTLKPGDHVIMANPSCGECPECLAGGRGARFSLEAAGFPEALRAAVEVLAPCGTACLVGSARAGVEVPLEMRTMQQGRVVRGCVQGESDVQTFLPRLIALYRAGKLPIERLVRHYAHAAINDAVADMLAGTTIKAVLQIDTASFPPSPAGDR